MKIVFDSNVFIAAFLAKGLASDILKLGETEKIEIYTSEEILKEVEIKLTQKSKLSFVYVEDFIHYVQNSAIVLTPKNRVEIVKSDPDDNKVLECAVEAEADLIISIDKHLLKLKKYGKCGIVHPKTLTWIIPNLLS